MTSRLWTSKTSAPAAVLAAVAVLLVTPSGASARVGRFAIPGSADQLIVVSSPSRAPSDHLATVRAFERAGGGSRWHAVLGPWQAEIGSSGLRNMRHEGDGSTPTGVFAIGHVIYGNDPRPPGLRLRYHRLVCGDWWDENPFSRRYNRFVHVPCGTTPAFAPSSSSEALWTETVAYPFFAVIDFNSHPVRGGTRAPGSAIFLHSWVGGSTAGCIALHEAQLRDVLRWLRPSSHPVIAIGTNRETGTGRQGLDPDLGG